MSEQTQQPEPPAAGVAYVIRSCDKDRKSYGGFQWPAEGPVTCPDWKSNKECGNGLHGVLWGIGDWSLAATSDPEAVWLVVEVQAAEVIDLDGKVKFPGGVVVYSGGLPGAQRLLAEKRLLHLASIASTAGDYAPASTAGYAAPASTAGNRAPASTAGDYAPASTAGDYAPASTAGNRAPASTAGYAAPASTAGNRATACCFGESGRARAGEGGSIILTYREDDGRPRHVVGYVGENGIKPHTWYEVRAGKLSECK